ncbi:sulfite exporter TauE/SafE family protein [Flavobacterium sp. '19STA2R22 D10 B1']|uniref:sulfite exporter TauE/SafE family protein n=1 Tax=Flavobacterium aerium TaxID=3037261 RepID=UPI00278C5F92|nr:sulfite exporter TauE/SafE family protein [Flavobacterium sp. '19STA2R22 D10 B1']
MSLIHIFGYSLALVVGIVLGLVGSGGSILTVPILVYMFNITPVIASAYSLFVVGSSSLIGALRNIQKKRIDYKTALIFAIPAVTTVYITRRYLIHLIPEELFSIGNIHVSKDMGIMIFFAFIMFFSAMAMIRNKTEEVLEDSIVEQNYTLLIGQGVFVGLISGLVGAGGGFLIIPALILLAKLPVKKAMATSLLIIAINSLVGFSGDLQTLIIDWKFLITFTGIAIIGIFIGMYLCNFIDGKKLKKGFGWFVLLMGLYILFIELTK